MHQSKFTLAEVFTLLTALGFGFICFLSINFYTLGDTTGSVLMAIIIAFTLAITAFGAKQLKRTRGNFKTKFIMEVACLLLFTCAFIFFAYSPFPHYWVVSEQKHEIQSKLATSISQAQNMFSEYERYAINRETLYRNRLRSVAAAKSTNPSRYSEYGFENNGIADNIQIENKMFTVHADLFPTNFKEMKSVDSTWIAEAQNIVESWKPIGIVSVVKDVEQNSNDWLSKLTELSKVREKGENTTDFTYELSFTDVKTHFTSLGEPTPLSIGLALLAYILLILSLSIFLFLTKYV